MAGLKASTFLGKTLQDKWEENFRMSRNTFMTLCEDIRPLLKRTSTKMRRPLSMETQVAVTLYHKGPTQTVLPFVFIFRGNVWKYRKDSLIVTYRGDYLHTRSK